MVYTHIVRKREANERKQVNRQGEVKCQRYRQDMMNGVNELKAKGIVNLHWDGEALFLTNKERKGKHV